MKLFLIQDETAGAINKIVNEQGLIAYANGSHFVEKDLSKPINKDWQVYACNDIETAKHILRADLFYVTELNFKKCNIYSL